MKARAVLAAALLTAAVSVAPLLAAEPEPAGVGVLTYDLGDTAFTRPGWPGRSELRAVVHYPAGHAPAPLPMVLMLHGRWWTCLDPATATPSMDWPCREEVASYRGFDYLGDALARHGFVAVSIGVNGLDAAHPAAGYRERAQLINEHLRMWRDLVTTGRGPLAGRLVDPVSGRPAEVDFAGLVDLSRVGTLGHGPGGTAVMRHAAAGYSWPRGVRVRAVVAAGAIYNHADPAELTGVPFAVLDGGCDQSRGRQYLEDVRGRRGVRAFAFTVSGANHNNLNTEWAPEDGPCADGRPGAAVRQPLGGADQRRVATGYIGAFFLRQLCDRAEYEPMLTGRTRPLADVATVEVAHTGR